VDKHQNDTDESKVFHSACYMKGCNKVASTSARLIINKKLELVIYDCNSCLPSVSGDVTIPVCSNTNDLGSGAGHYDSSILR
jgi:hypothetical protein